jgi:hypothetical protein
MAEDKDSKPRKLIANRYELIRGLGRGFYLSQEDGVDKMTWQGLSTKGRAKVASPFFFCDFCKPPSFSFVFCVHLKQRLSPIDDFCDKAKKGKSENFF